MLFMQDKIQILYLAVFLFQFFNLQHFLLKMLKREPPDLQGRMTHAGVPKKERKKAGIRDDLVRISVGCEDFEDLKADIDQAISQANRKKQF